MIGQDEPEQRLTNEEFNARQRIAYVFLAAGDIITFGDERLEMACLDPKTGLSHYVGQKWADQTLFEVEAQFVGCQFQHGFVCRQVGEVEFP
jgi:hypothetical protein